MSGDRTQAGRAEFDQLLGPSGRRYFGSGYRGVEYQLMDVRLRAGRVVAKADVAYRKGWSKKETEPERKPHLGTLDCVVLAAAAGEAVLEAAVGLDSEQLGRAWIEGMDIRAGRAPFEELSRVPVDVSVMKAPSETGTGALRTTVGGTVGGMTVSMTVRHEPPGSSPGVCLPLRDHLQKRPQSDLFRRTAHASSDIRIADSLSEVSAVHRLRPAADAPAEGLGSAYWPSPTVADAIVLSSQMAQVLIYHRQGVPREATRTLWMRRVSYQAATAPARLSQPEWNATLRLVSQKKFETAREILNSARVAASLSGGIELEADLAYFDAAGSAEPSAG